MRNKKYLYIKILFDFSGKKMCELYNFPKPESSERAQNHLKLIVHKMKNGNTNISNKKNCTEKNKTCQNDTI